MVPSIKQWFQFLIKEILGHNNEGITAQIIYLSCPVWEILSFWVAAILDFTIATIKIVNHSILFPTAKKSRHIQTEYLPSPTNDTETTVKIVDAELPTVTSSNNSGQYSRVREVHRLICHE